MDPHQDKGKRKADSMREKQPSRRGRGGAGQGSSGGASLRIGVTAEERRKRQDDTIAEEARLMMEGRTAHVPYTPDRIGDDFDVDTLRPCGEDVIERIPRGSRNFPIVSYKNKVKEVEKARDENPYEQPKDMGVDYRFWNVFHSNFYLTVIYNAKKPRIAKHQWIDFNDLRSRDDQVFRRIVRACEKHELVHLMEFRYDWNTEVIAQFHATYHLDIYQDAIHWMTEGMHYRIDFTTFSRILGFGSAHREWTSVHYEVRAEIRDIKFMYEDPDEADGKTTRLKSFYFVLNNMMRRTLNPKEGAATDLNGLIRNVLARMAPGGERFSVPRFMWSELRIASEDARKELPYAPYLMYIIERVSGIRFAHDAEHTAYTVGRLQAAGASRGAPSRPPPSARSDEPSSSRGPGGKKKGKISTWLKAIFSTCTYSATRNYENSLVLRETLRATREREGLPPLRTPSPPPRYELPPLSDTSSDDEQQQDSEEDEPQGQYGIHRYPTRYTATTHRAGRAVVESSPEGETGAGGVDWGDIERSDEE